MENGKESIYPMPHQNQDGTIQHNVYFGLSKREYFALHLMTALISNADRHSQQGECQTWNYEHLSEIAIQATNELLKQLEQIK